MLTINEILQAYENTGLTPIRKATYLRDENNGDICGCPMMAVAADRIGSVPTAIDEWQKTSIISLTEKYTELSEDQTMLFIEGFDNGSGDGDYADLGRATYMVLRDRLYQYPVGG